MDLEGSFLKSVCSRAGVKCMEIGLKIRSCVCILVYSTVNMYTCECYFICIDVFVYLSVCGVMV